MDSEIIIEYENLIDILAVIIKEYLKGGADSDAEED